MGKSCGRLLLRLFFLTDQIILDGLDDFSRGFPLTICIFAGDFGTRKLYEISLPQKLAQVLYNGMNS
jgi:hypothetical protein